MRKHKDTPNNNIRPYMPASFTFSKHLLNWFDEHGRHDLPWQKDKNAYRVWVSEIMLQQTQVETVIPYYQKFMQRFPKVEALAKADIDEVLHLWTGLGYYARARNLHKCAVQIATNHNGEFPTSVEALTELPGIGPSTAAAIASIAFNQPTAILDGNVKRVLTRFYAVEGWPGEKKIETALWENASELMPSERCADYTQAIMDLGATLCTRSKPQCLLCPVSQACEGRLSGDPTQFPHKKPKKAKPTKHCQMLMIYNTEKEVALYRRPESGIWGGLWSLPEIAEDESAEDYALEQFGEVERLQNREKIKHVFSHYTLFIQPVEIWLKRTPSKIMENQRQLWYNPHFPHELGLAAPVKKLLHG